jgi:frataxin
MTRLRLPQRPISGVSIPQASSKSSRIASRLNISSSSTCRKLAPSRSICLLSKNINRTFSASSYRSTSHRSIAAVPVDLSDDLYHQLADQWLENALVKFEDLQDEGQDIDVEFSVRYWRTQWLANPIPTDNLPYIQAGVMTIRTERKGTYVLNKQPPNKQIWLSSPISGPKRYDWAVSGDGQDNKEGTAAGRWIYTRDQTTLDQLMLEELGVDLEAPS